MPPIEQKQAQGLNLLSVVSEHYLPEMVIEVSCQDFDEYRKLPHAVLYKGIVCGKTGWSSDTHKCCYKQGAALAQPIEQRRVT